ncbi:hypothetical protein [Burkholderia sp. Ac-20379]|uniref:hypothetical protein n=1 Tax=Burkholderia sp. Ac-20379 TaxID=2703900 RepID=UPI00197F8DA7|nr:hypothetical protein [Burkholderia sp. Ac-20379]MBN3724988.1 hypothetical protein [Burkholderia sp. Ac-20379]
MAQQNFEVFQTARRLHDVGLRIGDKTLPIFDFAKRMRYENRTVVTVECVTSLAESSIGNYAFDESRHERHRIEIEAGGSIGFDDGGLQVAIPPDVVGSGEWELNVVAFLQTPAIGRQAGADEGRQRLIKAAELLVVYLVFCKVPDSTVQAASNRYLFDSYGSLGFVAVDVPRFNAFVRDALGAGRHDIVEAFTTTELAGDLFERGLMVLCWGITPWLYMITSHGAGEPVMFFPGNTAPACRGTYYLAGGIERVSIVPGNALTAWDTESQGEWPSLTLAGEGDRVLLDLYIAKTVDTATGECVPVPYFNMVRTGGEKRSEPILRFDILAGD